jgi:hypothetical protein
MMTEYCDVCGDPLSDHPDDFPCAPKPSYPELPEGCTIEPGRRQLAVGDDVRKGDRNYGRVKRGRICYEWINISPFELDVPVLEGEIISRAKETK